MSRRGEGREGQGTWRVEVEVTRREPEDPMVTITVVMEKVDSRDREASTHSGTVEVGRPERRDNSGWLGTR